MVLFITKCEALMISILKNGKNDCANLKWAHPSFNGRIQGHFCCPRRNSSHYQTVKGAIRNENVTQTDKCNAHERKLYYFKWRNRVRLLSHLELVRGAQKKIATVPTINISVRISTLISTTWRSNESGCQSTKGYTTLITTMLPVSLLLLYKYPDCTFTFVYR